MQNKKILIFSTAYYPFVAGAEVAVKEITDRMPDVEFHLLTAKMRKGLPFKEKIGNVTVFRLGIGQPFLDKLILALEGALFVRHLSKKNNYDYYWCVMASFAAGAAYIANIFLKKKVPIILNLQEGDSEKYLETRRFGLVNLSTRLAVKRANIITVLSGYLGERAKTLGFKGEPILVPNGVDIEKFDIELSNEERTKIRQEFGLEEGDLTLITASRLVTKNGVGDVIAALPSLDQNIKFIIIGGGFLEESLKQLAESLGVGERVIFKGFVSHAEMPKYLKACDIFIRSSLSEGFGNSFIEAMAAKIPVIATPVGGILDFLHEGETGYFCKPGDPQSIAETVRMLIDDPKKEEVVENAYQMAKEKYDWHNISLRMKQVFDSM